MTGFMECVIFAGDMKKVDFRICFVPRPTPLSNVPRPSTPVPSFPLIPQLVTERSRSAPHLLVTYLEAILLIE